MTQADFFWAVFAAVLSAILLGGTFFWGLITYTKHEKAGTAGRRESHLPLLAILLPMAFLLMGIYTAIGWH